ncbi:MAG: hypothetical protein COS82_06675 [Zetaproteobacteria bacterium CG06_land_8_20_14_3_00_59_53]|nr:MAG: hypothetical protein AUK36_03600 [Zetaproteobacteria bacterium CG2_30_59_37]PIO89922.1 MAG: hypothetical protein COX56_05990 [Zetaproteobacteria bacterium CG23_combo_of_CG06-09_8_20_14_all_59_86]PIQ64287.1 MAG: hypothetical protein COV97_10245 [Zetaproteobacteria bacterium CG11_big_fil_rev_8_21_14_0_20_59_439]PIU70367.1 MAG: hypothetical protein COS82_06675 [Zetaproteobacteria bacterium CG06_land_8_20_14_3_00_59_53]PIU97510.1 MAG: hypothetical protein COS62_03870 [Zetaproteobacteria bac
MAVQKSESQHKQAQTQPAAQQRKGTASLEPPQGERLARLEAMADSSPQVGELARLAAMANGTPSGQPVLQLEGGDGLVVTGTAMRDPLAKFRPASDAARQKVLDDTLTVEHQEALLDASNPYLFAVRETGAASIKRLREGAKAKPHTILEKSIKKSSLEAAYGAQAATFLEMAREKDIDGFVGHWRMERKMFGDQEKTVPVDLLGVRVDGYQGRHKEELTRPCPSGLFVPLEKLDEFKARHPSGAWKRLLYTGDYDLHEVYDNRGHQIAEGAEKARMVSFLNALIAPVDPSRTGEAHADAQHRTHVQGQYAMFQHGDQATYVANQHNEARASGSRMASVVAAVSRQSEDPMVWHYKHAYYVSLNRAEHDEFRANVRVVASQEFASNARSEQRIAGGLVASMDSNAGQHGRRAAPSGQSSQSATAGPGSGVVGHGRRAGQPNGGSSG